MLLAADKNPQVTFTVLEVRDGDVSSIHLPVQINARVFIVFLVFCLFHILSLLLN